MLWLAFMCSVTASQPTMKPLVLPLWTQGAPGSESRKNEAETRPHPWSIANIQNPSLTVYLPDKTKAKGVAVVICPGGGHSELVIDEEGTKPAKFFNDLGVTAIVLKYRLARERGSTLTVAKDTRADVYRAMRLVRCHAKEWGVDPSRVGMMGFSAGGECLSMAVFGDESGDPAATDPVDRLDQHPNFAIWIYPGPYGIPPVVPKTAPPGFLAVANDDGLSSLALFLAKQYNAAKAPMELHLFASGGHGFNMGDRFPKNRAIFTWPERLADWMSDGGWLTAK